MCAAFAHEFLEVRDQLTTDRGAEIAVGFAMAFLSSLVIIRPFLGMVRRSGFAPFAWYRIALGLALVGAISAGWVRG
jgi:undecaprenyl-diphosphatase